MNASEDDATLFNRLASLCFTLSRSYAPKARRSAATGRSVRSVGLGNFRRSADSAVRITGEESIASVTTLIQAHRYGDRKDWMLIWLS